MIFQTKNLADSQKHLQDNLSKSMKNHLQALCSKLLIIDDLRKYKLIS